MKVLKCCQACKHFLQEQPECGYCRKNEVTVTNWSICRIFSAKKERALS